MAGTLGLQNVWDLHTGAITFAHWCHCCTITYFYDYFTRSSTVHSYLVRCWSQTPNHRGQQTQDELFCELDKTLCCI